MNYTNEEIQAAQNEGEITNAQLLCEILPLLKEYMEGNFAVEGESISMKFMNGQKFTMQIKTA